MAVDKTTKEALDARHPLWTAYHTHWSYYQDAYDGGVDYCWRANPLEVSTGPESLQDLTQAQVTPGYIGARLYLWQYPLERSAKYRHRLGRAVCINCTAPVVDLYCGTVGKAENVVIDVTEGFQDFADDADMQGQSLLEFMAAARTAATVHGHAFILVDSPRATGPLTTQADVKDQNIRPYLRLILPSDLVNWRLDNQGKPLEILYHVQTEVPGSLMAGKTGDTLGREIRYWSRQEWRIYTKTGQDEYELTDAGPNPIGVVPLTCLYHKRRRAFLGESLIKDSSRIEQLLTNWASGFDEALENTMFAQMYIKSHKDVGDVGVGVDIVLHLDPDEKEEAGYIAPPTAPFEAGWGAFYRFLALAYERMGMKTGSAVSGSSEGKTATEQSGVSKAWDFYESEKIMASMAIHEQEAVKEIFGFAGLWQDVEWTGTAQYSTKYDLSTVTDDISNLISLQAANAPLTLKKELMRRISYKILTSLPADVRKALDKEIDAMSEVVLDPQVPPEDQAPILAAQKGTLPRGDPNRPNKPMAA